LEVAWMTTFFEYGLTPRSITAIVAAVLTLSLAMWGANRWRRARDEWRRKPPGPPGATRGLR
jgi:hypothetical protein